MKKIWFVIVLASVVMAGCMGARSSGIEAPAYGYPLTEPEWVRSGEPLEYEGEAWYPTDELERLLDPEVYPLGEYRQTQFFIDRSDVKPYDRLYTRFGKNRYRAFEKKAHD